MSWPNPGKETDEHLTDLKPVRVLYELDGPQIFICRDAHGDPLFAYQCAESRDGAKFLLVPFDDSLEGRLVVGQLTILEALQQPRVWLVDVNNDWEITSTRRTNLEEIPFNNLPRPGTMLWPELQPLLSIRSVGEEITRDDLLGSVIQNTVSRAEEALSRLITHVADRLGIPKKNARLLWDLPTQHLAFRSFEISFRAPAFQENSAITADQAKEVYTRVGELLRTGLTIADEKDGAQQPHNTDVEERLAVLEAAKALAPSGSGQVKAVELSGKLTGRTSARAVVLSNRTYKYARDATGEIKKKSTPDPRVQFLGHIKQVTEKHPREFVLHKRSNDERVTFVFDDEHEGLWNDATEALRTGTQVLVSGVRKPKAAKVFVTAINPSPVSEGTEVDDQSLSG